jgi:hypothetical protein
LLYAVHVRRNGSAKLGKFFGVVLNLRNAQTLADLFRRPMVLSIDILRTLHVDGLACKRVGYKQRQ